MKPTRSGATDAVAILDRLVGDDADLREMIAEETVSLEGVNVVIAEGTYTSILEKIDFRAFIDRTYHDTLKHRKKRARDPAEGEFINRVLEIEHEIISAHKARADIVLPP